MLIKTKYMFSVLCTMRKNTVLRRGLVMLGLFALGSGVAQAQECIVRSGSNTVRAEGITEAVGTIELRCEEPTGRLGFGSPDVLEITVELNTRITSLINNDRKVMGLMYTEEAGMSVHPEDFSAPPGDGEAAELSEDGTIITWEIASADINLGPSTIGRFSDNYRRDQSQRLQCGKW